VAFTPEQIRRIEIRLEEVALHGGKTCELCGQFASFRISDGFVFLPREDLVDQLAVAGTGYPLVLLTCNHCGNTYFVNMLVLGLEDIIEPHLAVGSSGSGPRAGATEGAPASA
jgi:hypothetical protein